MISFTHVQVRLNSWEESNGRGRFDSNSAGTRGENLRQATPLPGFTPLSSSCTKHHGFHWEIWAGKSGELWAVSGSHRYFSFFSITHPLVDYCGLSIHMLSFTFVHHRAVQRQDRPQSNHWGGSGRGQIHLDTEHSQLDLVQQFHCWWGVWAEDHDRCQFQGKSSLVYKVSIKHTSNISDTNLNQFFIHQHKRQIFMDISFI